MYEEVVLQSVTKDIMMGENGNYVECVIVPRSIFREVKLVIKYFRRMNSPVIPKHMGITIIKPRLQPNTLTANALKLYFKH